MDTIIDHPEYFFTRDDSVCKTLCGSLEALHNEGRQVNDQYSTLQAFVTKDCDTEQIWQQIQLTTNAVLENLGFTFADLEDEIEEEEEIENAEAQKFLDSDEDESENVEEETHPSEKVDEVENEDEKQNEEVEENAEPGELKQTTDQQDEFLMEDFEKFHAMMESGGMNSEEESENEEDELEQLKYAAKGAINEEDLDNMLDKSKFQQEEDEKITRAEDLSTYEKSQEALQSVIEKLEEKSLAGRAWTLMGEADVRNRPKDGLVAQDLEFARGDKLKPVITTETTEELEDIIRRRILDLNFDDVERKALPKQKKKRKVVELDSEKSSMGLAELYERDFMDRAKENLGLETSQEEKLSKEHAEILKLKIQLFHQLDSLCNFHFTPEPANLDVKVATESAAIDMEEAMPSAQVNPDISQLAPEELHNPEKESLLGETEKTREEKKAEHRANKRKKRKREQQRNADSRLLARHNEKLKSAMDAKTLLDRLAPGEVKEMKRNDDVKYGSSKTVFTLLQDQQNSKMGPKKKKRKVDKSLSRSLKL